MAKTCLDCGKDISERPPQSRRCVDCAEARCKRSRAKARDKWDRSEAGRKCASRYARSEKGKAASKRAYLKRDKEKKRERDRQDYQKHREKRLVSSRKWSKENPEEHKAAVRRWAQEHPERIRERLRQYQTKKRNRLGVVPENITEKMMLEQEGRCNHCSKSLKQGYHIDHIVPLSKGGMHDEYNLQLLCPHCNQVKHDSVDAKWFPPWRKMVEGLYG